MSRPKSQPSYCVHKRSNRAYVTIDGSQIPLGEGHTPQSREAYDRLIAQWLLNGRKLPEPVAPGSSGGPKVSVIIERFYVHAQAYYVKPDGSQSAELTCFRYALRFLRRLYGSTAAADFGPKALKALREAMIRPAAWTDRGREVKHGGWCRKYANHQVNRIKHVFKWAAGEELIPPSVYHGLLAVEGLRRGRSEARESAPVKPAPEAMVLQVLNHLPDPVRAMVELEALIGARGGELCIMRGCDIDTSNDAMWIYRPSTHKTAHHGHEREIPLGKRCQELIRPFLKANPQAFLFSPSDWEAQRRADRSVARKTPIEYGNRPGTNRSDDPKRPPGERYDADSYRRAVDRACLVAFLPPAHLQIGRVKTGPKRSRSESKAEWRKRLGEEKWTELLAWQKAHRFSPHQLRHSAATRLRKLFGLEAAGVVLGQKTMAATLIYAEQDKELAAKVMKQIG